MDCCKRKERLVQITNEYKNVKIRPVSIDLQKEKSEIQIIINNSGFEKIGYFKYMNISDILSIIDVNIKGMTAINRLCLPYMKKGSFEIITGSVSSFSLVSNQAVYSASKKYVYYFGKAFYIPGGFYKFYRICSKIAPSAFMVKIAKRFF